MKESLGLGERATQLPPETIFRLLFEEAPVRKTDSHSAKLNSVIAFNSVVRDSVVKWRSAHQCPAPKPDQPYWARIPIPEGSVAELKFGPRPDFDPVVAILALRSLRLPGSLRRFDRTLKFLYSPTKAHPELTVSGTLSPWSRSRPEMSISLPAGESEAQFVLRNIHDGLVLSLDHLREAQQANPQILSAA